MTKKIMEYLNTFLSLDLWGKLLSINMAFRCDIKYQKLRLVQTGDITIAFKTKRTHSIFFLSQHYQTRCPLLAKMR